MKALTLWQPWASMVAFGQKRVETRCWSTKYRGEIAIHSAAAIPPTWLGASRHNPDFKQEVADVLNCRIDRVDSEVRSLPLGKVLCIVRLDSIEECSRVRDIIDTRERIFGNYEDGRYAWFLEMLRKPIEPIATKGNRMLWNWNDDGARYECACDRAACLECGPRIAQRVIEGANFAPQMLPKRKSGSDATNV